MILFTCFEMNGALVVLTFATKIILSTGIEFDISPEVQTLSIPIVMLMASVLLTSCVERCGRKVRRIFFTLYSIYSRVGRGT